MGDEFVNWMRGSTVDWTENCLEEESSGRVDLPSTLSNRLALCNIITAPEPPKAAGFQLQFLRGRRSVRRQLTV